MAAILVGHAGRAKTHTHQQWGGPPEKVSGMAVSTPAPHVPLVRVLLLLLLWTDTPEGRCATPNTRVRDAADSGGGGETALYGPAPPAAADKNDVDKGA